MFKEWIAYSEASPVPDNGKIDVMLKTLGVSLIFMCLMVLGCATLSMDTSLSNDAFTSIEKGDYNAAEEQLTKALEINPNNPYALMNMGVTYLNTNRIEEARKMFQKVIDIGGDHRVAKSNHDWATEFTLTEVARDNLSLINYNISLLRD